MGCAALTMRAGGPRRICINGSVCGGRAQARKNLSTQRAKKYPDIIEWKNINNQAFLENLEHNNE
jgi:hypothetical protein